MAENTTPEEGATPKKGKLKLIIMLVVIIVLAVALSIAGTLWFLGGGLPGMGGESGADAEPEFVASSYVNLDDPLVTTVRTEGRQRYAQVYLSFEAKDPEALAAVELHMPLLRSELTTVLSNTGFTGLQSPEGRVALASEMTETVNQILEQEQEPAIEGVLFRNFVVQ